MVQAVGFEPTSASALARAASMSSHRWSWAFSLKIVRTSSVSVKNGGIPLRDRNAVVNSPQALFFSLFKRARIGNP